MMPQLMMLLSKAGKLGRGVASKAASYGSRAANYGGAYSARNIGSYGAKRAGEMYAKNPRAFQIGGAALGGAALGSVAGTASDIDRSFREGVRDRFGHGIESRSDGMSDKQVMDKLEAAARYLQKGEEIPNEILESLMGLNPNDFSQDAGSSLAAFQSYVAPQEDPRHVMY